MQPLNGLKFRPTLIASLVFTADPARHTPSAGTLMIGPSNSGNHLATWSVPKNSRATPDLGSER
jgi:hypothetical protein